MRFFDCFGMGLLWRVKGATSNHLYAHKLSWKSEKLANFAFRLVIAVWREALHHLCLEPDA